MPQKKISKAKFVPLPFKIGAKMRLTRLEIKGFKSFGDKVVVHFDEGITGVVGPNGCGKSNIVDAIRWVLGEHRSKNLRSDKMDNVIFNGTDKRNPAQYAEVSLSFENNRNLLPSEYTEVNITRRYSRNGTGEYFLNDTPCRLKDVAGLLLNTGISANSYAIIELKMVDDILQDRDNARKAMFEEAAGISKFKARKKETLQKLEAADADLARVEDVLFEVEKSLKNLEKQAKQAERFHSAKDAYQKLSIALAKRQARKSVTEFADLNEKIEQETKLKQELSDRYEWLNESIETLKKHIEDKENTLTEQRKLLAEVFHQIRQAENDAKIRFEKLRFLKEKKENLVWQIENERQVSHEAAVKSLRENLEIVTQKLISEENTLAELQNDWQRQQQKNEIIREEVEVIKAQKNTKQQEIALNERDYELKNARLASLKHEREQTAADITAQRERNEEFNEQLGEINVSISELTDKIQKLKNDEADLQLQIENIAEEIETDKENLSQFLRQLDAKIHEHKLTKSLNDNLEGFSQAVRFLQTEKSWQDKALLFADIIRVRGGYEAVLAQFLEPFLNYYVVEDEKDAFFAIQLLNENKKGRAQFFILSALKDFVPATRLNLQKIIPASDLLIFDEKYRNLINYVFSGVYVSEAENLPESRRDLTLIDKKGEIISRFWQVQGGAAQGLDSSVLGRKRKLEELAEQIQNIESEKEQVENLLNEKKRFLENLKTKTQRNEILKSENELAEMRQKKAALNARLEQLLLNEQNGEQKLQDLKAKISEIESELAELLPFIERKKQEFAKIEEKAEKLIGDFESKNALLQEKINLFNLQKMECERIKNQIESLEKEIRFKEETAKNTQRRIEQAKADLQKTSEEIEQLNTLQQESEGILEELNLRKQDVQEQVNHFENEFYQTKNEITEQEKQTKEILRQRENCDARLAAHHQRLGDTRVSLAGARERILAEFQIELTQEMLEEHTPEDDLNDETLAEQISFARSQIDKIGSVNNMAIDEYKQVKERYDFICSQRADLAEAKESLEKTIREIEETAKEQFLEAFEKIRRNFQELFQTLFNEGDTSDLILTNPEDPLESKIDIVAKPKGKRPLSIKQLSGGEKTLTATALLFAIYLLRPAPFCIFDEVDAPLDDTNIDKFNKIIKKFTGEVQFIIVTHNKRTMVHTDVIYGVTMVEQGVSRVVAVDLKALALPGL